MAKWTSSTRGVCNPSTGSPQLTRPSNARIKQLVAFLSVVCFLNSVPGKLVFDDHEVIQTNRDVRSSTPLSSVFSNDFWGEPLQSNTSHKSYRPLTILTFRWNHYLHGVSPLGYHVINVLLHTAVSVLFVSVCDVIFQGMTSSRSATLLASVLFAVHPIHTEAVANVTGRADILCGLFYMLSFLCYTKCFQTRSLSSRTNPSPQGNSTKTYPPPQRSWRPVAYSKAWLALCLSCSTLALLSKELGITVIAVCLSYDVICVCSVTMGTVKELVFSVDRSAVLNKRSWPKWLRSLVERAVVLALFCILLLYVRIVIIGGGLPTSFVESDNPTHFHPDTWTRVRTYAYIIALNGWLLICPSKLCYDWSMDSIARVETLWDVRNLATGSFMFVMCILIYKALRLYHTSNEVKTQSQEVNGVNAKQCADVNKNVSKATDINIHRKSPEGTTKSKLVSGKARYGRVVLFALSMTIIPFLPASNLFFPVGFVIAERVLYLPSMGFCILMTLGIRAVFGINHRETGPSNAGQEVVMNGHGPNVNSKDAKPSSDSVPSKPSAVPGLSLELSGLGRLFVYIMLLVLSVKTIYRNFDWYDTGTLASAGLHVNPDNAKIQLTMGNDFAQKGFRICEKYYRDALRLRPRYVLAWVNLGLVLVNTERVAEAEAAYMKALSLNPNSGDANTNLAHLLRISHRDDEALYRYNKALSIRSGDPVLHFYYGHVLERLGRTKEAIQSYLKTAQIIPDDGRAYLALGRVLGQPLVNNQQAPAKAMSKAAYYLRLGLRLSPDEIPPRLLLAILHLKQDEISEAKDELLHILTRDEHNIEAEYLLGLAFEREGKLKEAAKLFRIVLKREDTHPRASVALERLKTKRYQEKKQGS